AASDTAPEIYAGSLPFDCMPDLQFAHPEATIRSGSGYPDWSKKSTQEIIELKLLPCLFEKANGDAKAGFQSDSLSNVFLGSNLGYLIAAGALHSFRGTLRGHRSRPLPQAVNESGLQAPHIRFLPSHRNRSGTAR